MQLFLLLLLPVLMLTGMSFYLCGDGADREGRKSEGWRYKIAGALMSKLSAEEQQALLALWQSRSAATEMPAAMLERLSGPGFILRVGEFTPAAVFRFREPPEWVVSYEGMCYLVQERLVPEASASALLEAADRS